MAKKTELSIRCVVASIDKGGAPHLFPVLVHCSQEDVDNGCHYDAADDEVESESLSPCITFDEHDDEELIKFVFGRYTEIPEVTI